MFKKKGGRANVPPAKAPSGQNENARRRAAENANRPAAETRQAVRNRIANLQRNHNLSNEYFSNKASPYMKYHLLRALAMTPVNAPSNHAVPAWLAANDAHRGDLFRANSTNAQRAKLETYVRKPVPPARREEAVKAWKRAFVTMDEVVKYLAETSSWSGYFDKRSVADLVIGVAQQKAELRKRVLQQIKRIVNSPNGATRLPPLPGRGDLTKLSNLRNWSKRLENVPNGGRPNAQSQAKQAPAASQPRTNGPTNGPTRTNGPTNGPTRTNNPTNGPARTNNQTKTNGRFNRIKHFFKRVFSGYTKYEVPGDGNCMFTSVVVAWWWRNCRKVPSVAARTKAAHFLRLAVVEKLADSLAAANTSARNNMLVQWRSAVVDDHIIPNVSRDYVDMLSKDEFAQLYLTEMAKGGTWGGDPELLAIADVLQTVIQVYDNGRLTEIAPSQPLKEPRMPLILGYYDKNHYNPLLPGVDKLNTNTNATHPRSTLATFLERLRRAAPRLNIPNNTQQPPGRPSGSPPPGSSAANGSSAHGMPYNYETSSQEEAVHGLGVGQQPLESEVHPVEGFNNGPYVNASNAHNHETPWYEIGKANASHNGANNGTQSASAAGANGGANNYAGFGGGYGSYGGFGNEAGDDAFAMAEPISTGRAHNRGVNGQAYMAYRNKLMRAYANKTGTASFGRGTDGASMRIHMFAGFQRDLYGVSNAHRAACQSRSPNANYDMLHRAEKTPASISGKELKFGNRTIALERKVGARVWLGRYSENPVFVRTIKLSREDELIHMQTFSRLAVCNLSPHFPILYGAGVEKQGSRGSFVALCEPFHGTLRGWLASTLKQTSPIVSALAQLMMALGVLHGRNIRHGALSPDNIVLFKYPSHSGWWVYRIGNRDIYVRKAGTLFALNNFSKSAALGNGRAEPHCEVVALLNMFRRRLRRALYDGLMRVAVREKLDAAMFMRHPRVIRLFNTYASHVVTTQKHATNELDRYDVLPPGYTPRRGTGNCKNQRTYAYGSSKGLGDAGDFFAGMTFGLARRR